MRFVFAFFAFITAVWACSGTNKLVQSPVEFRQLNNYSINPNSKFPDSINHIFITNKDDFHSMFSMTKTVLGRAIVPDLTTQSVIAIILQPSENIITVEVNKAEIAGTEMNVFYTITDTTTWKSYAQIPKIIGTIAKNTTVEKVNFYRNNKKEKTVAVSY